MTTTGSQAKRWRFWVVAALMLVVLMGVTASSRAQMRIEVRPFESMTLTSDAFLRAEAGKAVVIAGELRIPRPGPTSCPR